MEQVFEEACSALRDLGASVLAEYGRSQSGASSDPDDKTESKDNATTQHRSALIPALNEKDLAFMAHLIAEELEGASDELRASINPTFPPAVPERVEELKQKVVPKLFDDTERGQAYFAYISTLEHFRKALRLSKALSSHIATVKKSTDRISEFEKQVVSSLEAVQGYQSSASDIAFGLRDTREEIEATAKKANETFRLVTAIGLAGEFDKRTKDLEGSVKILQQALIGALGSGVLLSLIGCLIAEKLGKSGYWLPIVPAGAAAWVAWLATKQINQRFRLAEDYAFKSTIAKSYEGYKVEAGSNEELKARLFGILLSRLDEHPLRFVEQASHGSPWHELLGSWFSKKGLSNIHVGMPENIEKLITAFAEAWLAFKKPRKAGSAGTGAASTDQEAQ